MGSRSDPLGCLEPPSCPSCQVKMRWFRSELVRQGHWAFAHLFLCPKCERPEITETRFAATSVLPDSRDLMFGALGRICRN